MAIITYTTNHYLKQLAYWVTRPLPKRYNLKEKSWSH